MTTRVATLLKLATAALMGLVLTACGPAKTTFHAMDVSGAQWGKGFALPDLNGKPVTQADFPGKLTVVFFGFMYCPDACPTHLTKMGNVKGMLGKDANKLQLVFITVDPLRDTPEKLAPYLNAFDPSIVGLRGTQEQTDQTAKEFRVFYKKVDTKASATDPLAYTIDHTTFGYVFDGKGQLRLVIPHDLAEDKIADDFKNLLSR
jgi:protein SCO1